MIIPNGRKIQLRKPEESDVDKLIHWLQDPLFIKYLYGSQLQSRHELNQHAYQILNQNAKDTNTELTLLMESKKHEAFGLIMFKNINWKDRNAEYNVAIGVPQFRNSFNGIEANLLALIIGFYELNLHKIYGYVYHNNASQRHIIETAGHYEGTLRKHYYRDGAFVDLNVYSFFSAEFKDLLLSLKDTVLKKTFQQGYWNEYL